MFSSSVPYSAGDTLGSSLLTSTEVPLVPSSDVTLVSLSFPLDFDGFVFSSSVPYSAGDTLGSSLLGSALLPPSEPVLELVGFPELALSLDSSCDAAVSSRDAASRAGGSVLAAEVSVLARVELLPLTGEGSASRFWLNSPPARVDSAARESEATMPAPSLIGCSFARGSVVFCESCS